jgi:metallo-beta-lactamase family protein
MHIEFCGAAREVTGSCHLLTVGSETIALDFGLFQGRREESRKKNLALPDSATRLSGIVLSHAHIDHCGRLPYVVSKGFRGNIWATPASRDLAAVMLSDSARLQEHDADFLTRRRREVVAPFYTVEDALRTAKQIHGVPYRRDFEPARGVRAHFVDAGHILGSASVVLDCTEDGKSQRVVFSGDIGRTGLAIIGDPVPPEGANVLIMESTYGNRLHESVEGSRNELAHVVRDTAARGGRVLIPAFALGRVQEVLYELHGLAREGRIPSIPIFIDSPLAIDVTAVFDLHRDVFDTSEALVRDVEEPFRFPLVKYTRSVDESKALNAARGPMIIIAASGMVEAGRILHHLAHGASDPRNTILIVGFQAQNTLGRRIVEQQPTIKVFGDEMPLRAQVSVINGYSAHADRDGLLAWLDSVREKSPKLKKVFLVHGEAEAQDSFAEEVRKRGLEVEAPTLGAVRTIE